MDILIPLGIGSVWDNWELRFVLRGVERHLKGYSRIIIIGEHTKYLKGVTNLRMEESMAYYDKEKNIRDKILKACETDISEDFLFMNDDHFLLSDYEVAKFPYYYSGLLTTKYKQRSDRNPYKLSVQNTSAELIKYGHPVKDFDVHSPIIYNKTEFPKIMDSYNWKLKSGFVIKSLYCNTLRIEGEEMSDMKLRQECDFDVELKDRRWFSIDNAVIRVKFKKYLVWTFPEKSSFEL